MFMPPPLSESALFCAFFFSTNSMSSSVEQHLPFNRTCFARGRWPTSARSRAVCLIYVSFFVISVFFSSLSLFPVLFVCET